jgi:DNA modification methylase
LSYGLDWTKHRSNIKTPDHPHQKPVEVVRWLVRTMSNPGDTIFDPFMGSGTTGVACMQLGRNFIGCEIDEDYFKIAEKRISEAAMQPPLFTDEPPASKLETQAELLP